VAGSDSLDRPSDKTGGLPERKHFTGTGFAALAQMLFKCDFIGAFQRPQSMESRKLMQVVAGSLLSVVHRPSA
jgi:hypothetical protein